MKLFMWSFHPNRINIPLDRIVKMNAWTAVTFAENRENAIEVIRKNFGSSPAWIEEITSTTTLYG